MTNRQRVPIRQSASSLFVSCFLWFPVFEPFFSLFSAIFLWFPVFERFPGPPVLCDVEYLGLFSLCVVRLRSVSCFRAVFPLVSLGFRFSSVPTACGSVAGQLATAEGPRHNGTKSATLPARRTRGPWAAGPPPASVLRPRPDYVTFLQLLHSPLPSTANTSPCKQRKTQDGHPGIGSVARVRSPNDIRSRTPTIES